MKILDHVTLFDLFLVSTAILLGVVTWLAR